MTKQRCGHVAAEIFDRCGHFTVLIAIPLAFEERGRLPNFKHD